MGKRKHVKEDGQLLSDVENTDAVTAKEDRGKRKQNKKEKQVRSTAAEPASADLDVQSGSKKKREKNKKQKDPEQSTPELNAPETAVKTKHNKGTKTGIDDTAEKDVDPLAKRPPKREKRKKAAITAAASDVDKSNTDAPPAKKAKRKAKANPVKLVAAQLPAGNVEEAEAMRQRFGIKAADPKSSTTKQSFAFAFNPALADSNSSDDESAVELPDQQHRNHSPMDNRNDANDPAAEFDADGTRFPGPPTDSVRSAPQARVSFGKVDSDGYIERRAYIGGMPFWYTEEEVRACWETCGAIEDMAMLNFPDTGRFRGIAFVTFETQEAFEEALKYNGEELEGMTLVVKRCHAPTQRNASEQPTPRLPAQHKGTMDSAAPKAGLGTVERKAFDAPPQKVAGYNVAFVGNIPWEINKQAVEDMFSSFSPKMIRMFDDPVAKRHKGFAHVHFNDEASLDKAMALNGSNIMGRKLKVMYAQPSAKHQETKAQNKKGRKLPQKTDKVLSS